jgi:purine-binding chemotaxis protein CheW
VYRFRKKIGKEENLDIDNKVVVVRVNDINIGIKIDAVKEIANINNENVFPLPRIAKGANTKYIKRVANINKDLVLLLNLDAIVSMEDLDHIDRIMSTVQ